MRGAIERRLGAVERAWAAIDGLSVERRGNAVVVRGRDLLRRSIEDVRLRFAGLGR
ncbi:MAG TPA: hypothetical protein VFT07_06600 [Sphingomicrobium sp.]|nr:hypothetical protein [Sphingomicrobium sp.]